MDLSEVVCEGALNRMVRSCEHGNEHKLQGSHSEDSSLQGCSAVPLGT